MKFDYLLLLSEMLKYGAGLWIVALVIEKGREKRLHTNPLRSRRKVEA